MLRQWPKSTLVCTSVVQFRPCAPCAHVCWTLFSKRPVLQYLLWHTAYMWIVHDSIVYHCFNEMQRWLTVLEWNLSLVGSNQARVTVNGAQASSRPRSVVITPLDTWPPVFSQRQHQAIITQGRPLSTIKAVCKSQCEGAKMPVVRSLRYVMFNWSASYKRIWPMT